GQNPGIGYFCVVMAESEGAARLMMSQEYDNKWCGTYHTAEKAGVKRFNLTEVDFGFRFSNDKEGGLPVGK
ncbi:MAG: hypothetical protein KAS32_17975, partial [Candidatus Peribacteraceae bacterium]|nr:hypothetical protein [Candidatus Peribacteraceae bacterium]